MKSCVLLSLSLVSGVAIAAGIPIGKYIQASENGNNLPSTSLNHSYLPFTGTMTVTPSYTNGSTITTTSSSSSGGGGGTTSQFGLSVVNTTSSLAAADVSVAVVSGASGTSWGWSACQVSDGTTNYVNVCEGTNGLPLDLTAPYQLYLAQNNFSSSNYATVPHYQTCNYPQGLVSLDAKTGIYTLSQALPYTLKITGGSCTITAA